MPNWVDNEIHVYGSKKDLQKIKKQIKNKDGELDFSKIVPTPDHPDYNNEPISFDNKSPFNWYNWNIDNWGTKWNASDSYLGRICNTNGDTYGMQICFSTAWSPSLPVTEALSRQHPNVFIEHKFIEEGNFFCGVYEYSAGELTHDSWEGEPSHENMERLGRGCMCEFGLDEEYWYDDCPSPKTNSIVELAKAMPDNISIINVS